MANDKRTIRARYRCRQCHGEHWRFATLDKEHTRPPRIARCSCFPLEPGERPNSISYAVADLVEVQELGPLVVKEGTPQFQAFLEEMWDRFGVGQFCEIKDKPNADV